MNKNDWIRVFAGTPQRFLITLCATSLLVLAIVSQTWPGVINKVLSDLAQELMPLFHVGLTFLIMVVGFKIMLKGFKSSGKRRH